jgi:hypothetical protein
MTWQDGAGAVGENLSALSPISKIAVHAANSLFGFKTNISVVTQLVFVVWFT